MSSTPASSSPDAPYIRARAQLAGTVAAGPAGKRWRRQLVPLLALIAVLAWVFAGVDRLADAELRSLTTRVPATTTRSGEIIGAWRGIGDMLGDGAVLPEDDAITTDGTGIALDRFQWMQPKRAAAGSPVAEEAPPTPIAAPTPAPAPVNVHAVPSPAGGHPVARLTDPFAIVKILAPARPPAMTSDDDAPPAAKAVAPPAPVAKRPVQPAAVKHAPERPRSTRRAVTRNRPPAAGQPDPMAWADIVTRRREAP